MYKKGDTVRIYTWNELAKKFPMNGGGDILVRNEIGWRWERDVDEELPQSRIIILNDSTSIPAYYNNYGGISFVYQEVIKCHANEYYLQEIKEELNV